MTGDIWMLIGELENIVASSKDPLIGAGQKKIVEAEEIYAIIEQMRDSYPQELQLARRTLKERDEMLESAEIEAARIINDAKEQAMIIAGEQEIVRLAQQRANDIMDEAREMERETRFGAEDYADQVFTHLEDNLKKLTDSVVRCRERLNSASQSGSNVVDW